MLEFFISWGFEQDIKSTISGYFENACLVSEYYNTLTFSPSNTQSINFEGHIIKVELKDGDIPDVFSVEPDYGWFVVSESNPVNVEEGSTGKIVLCQVSMS